MSDCLSGLFYHHLIDARGLNCPLPVLKAKQGVRRLKAAQVLCLISTDSNSINDVSQFCKRDGHRLVQSVKKEGGYYFYIQK